MTIYNPNTEAERLKSPSKLAEMLTNYILLKIIA